MTQGLLYDGLTTGTKYFSLVQFLFMMIFSVSQNFKPANKHSTHEIVNKYLYIFLLNGQAPEPYDET